MAELIFEATQEENGGYTAECLTENIFTQGDSWKEVRENVREATLAYYFDQTKPENVRLRLVRNEILFVP